MLSLSGSPMCELSSPIRDRASTSTLIAPALCLTSKSSACISMIHSAMRPFGLRSVFSQTRGSASV